MGYVESLKYLRTLDIDQLYEELAKNHREEASYQIVKDELDRKLQGETASQVKQLITATELMTKSVNVVATSSKTLERLTERLKLLTILLIFITIIAALVPVGIEVWKANR